MSLEEKEDGAAFDPDVDADFLSDLIGDEPYDADPEVGKVVTSTFSSPEDEDMREFLSRKDAVLSDLDIIVQKTEQIRQITEKLETVYDQAETTELQDDLLKHVKSGDYRTMRSKKKLNQLKKSTKELKKQPGKRVKSQVTIRKNLQATLEKRFIEVTRDLQEAKGAYQSRLRQNITRQVQIADPQATDEDIAEAIENGTAHTLIQRALNRSSAAHVVFEEKAQDVADRSKKIKELEQSMLALKKMFEELTQLIEMQSEQVDAIELTIEDAASNVEEGEKELNGVVHEQKEIRKRITILLVVLGVCIVGGAIAGLIYYLVS